MQATYLFLLLLIHNSLHAYSYAPPTQFSPSNGKNVHLAPNLIVWEEAGVRASLFSNMSWGTPVTLSATGSSPKVALDHSGTALAVFEDAGIVAFHWNGKSWSLSQHLSNSGEKPVIAMDGRGNALAGWSDSGNVSLAFYKQGVWGPVTTFSGNNISVAYSKSGAAVAAWENSVAIYNDHSWVVYPLSIGSSPIAGIDDKGQPHVIWNSGNTIQVATFTDAWETKRLSTGSQPDLAVNGAGKAVAVWQNKEGRIVASRFIKKGWTPHKHIGRGINPKVTLDAFGDVVAVWGGNGGIFSATFSTALRRWQAPKIVQNSSQTASPLVSCSSGKVIFVAWIANVAVFGTQTEPPAPPSNLVGKSGKNRFATESDPIHQISFTASTDPTVIAYLIRRNGKQIATLSATEPLLFNDHHRHKKDVYTVTALDVLHIPSSSISITLK